MNPSHHSPAVLVDSNPQKPIANDHDALIELTLCIPVDAHQPSIELDEKTTHFFSLWNHRNTILLLFIFLSIIFWLLVSAICIAFAGQRAIWLHYGEMIVVVLFVLRHLWQVITAFVFNRQSLLFEAMPAHVRSNDIGMICNSLWFFFWTPITLFLAYQSFVYSADEFSEHFLPFSRVTSLFFILSEWYDLSHRKFDILAITHHSVETVLICLFLNVIPSDRGLFILGLLSPLDRAIWIVFPLSHIIRQGNVSPIATKSYYRKGSMLAHPTLYQPTFSKSLFNVAFWYYAVFVKIFVTCLTITYQCIYYSEISSGWRVLLPMGNIIFIAVDIDVYILLYKKSKE